VQQCELASRSQILQSIRTRQGTTAEVGPGSGAPRLLSTAASAGGNRIHAAASISRAPAGPHLKQALLEHNGARQGHRLADVVRLAAAGGRQHQLVAHAQADAARAPHGSSSCSSTSAGGGYVQFRAAWMPAPRNGGTGRSHSDPTSAYLRLDRVQASRHLTPKLHALGGEGLGLHSASRVSGLWKGQARGVQGLSQGRYNANR